MGSALAASLLATDHYVVCFDIRPDVLRPIVELGAEAAADARELAGACDVVLTFLPGPSQVLEVALGSERGVLAGLADGAALLDMSTCNPEVAAIIGQAYDAAGRRFVDCPVSRKAPNMTVLVGGPSGVLGPDADVLAAVSRTLVYCGHRGAGYATKLLNQHIKYSWYLASAEALLIAEAMGLNAGDVADAIAECSGGTRVSPRRRRTSATTPSQLETAPPLAPLRKTPRSRNEWRRTPVSAAGRLSPSWTSSKVLRPRSFATVPTPKAQNFFNESGRCLRSEPLRLECDPRHAV
ncbi:NAD(P)-dependent oxidoreductase [Mycolicibacterium sp. D3]